MRAALTVKKDALLVPQRAVTELQGGYQVAVVDKDDVVHIRPVKAGVRSGELWVIDEGLSSGERVVAEGIQKVKEAMKVSPKPFESLNNNSAQAVQASPATDSAKKR